MYRINSWGRLREPARQRFLPPLLQASELPRSSPHSRWPRLFGLVAVVIAVPLVSAQGPQPGAHATQSGGVPAGRVETAPEAFWEAVRLDDVNQLQTQMLRGAGANANHPELGPAIVVAARERSPKVLAYLARLPGTRIDVGNANDETALMLVALHGDLDSVRLLVERGAEVNRKGWTPLHYAAANGQLPTIEFLLERSAYIDAESPNRTTPLMMAARHEHTNAVHLLVEAGADPTLRNEAGYTAADYMAAHGEAAEASWLRERAAAFARRYGSVAEPRPASEAGTRSAAPTGPAADSSGAADSTEAAGSIGAAGSTGAAASTGAPSPTGAASSTEADAAEVTTQPVAPRPRLPGSRD